MKKVCIILTLMFLLTGCSLQTFEKVEDGNVVQAMATPASLLIDLPESAAAPAMKGNSGSLYFCDQYDISVEVLPSGNLNDSVKTLTGYERENLTLVQTQRGNATCYTGVWSTAGEAGDYVGRLLILDDGSFHYCVSIMARANIAGECAQEWNDVFASVRLEEN